MDKKADIFQNSQITNQINGLLYQNPYNILIKNNLMTSQNQFENNFQNQNINQNNEVTPNIPKK